MRIYRVIRIGRRALLARLAVGCALVLGTLAFASSSASAAWRLYSNDYSDKTISGFTIDTNGSLSPVPGSPLPTADYPQSLGGSPDARFMVAGFPFTDDALVNFAIGADGALSDGSGSVPAPNGPYAEIFSRDSKLLYAGFDGGTRVFNVGATGSLSEVPGSPVSAAPTAGYVLAAAGQRMYALSHSGGPRIDLYLIQASGLPAPPNTLPLSDYDNASAMAITPDGTYLYVLGSPSAGNDVLEGFSIGADGSLAPAGTVTASGPTARDAAITPNGAFLYVTEQNSHSITGYSIGADGRLSQVDQFVIADLSPDGLTIAPDGRFLYSRDENPTPSRIDVLAIGANGRLTDTGFSAPTGESDGTTLVTTPDQPPTAAFDVTTKPGKQVFDASGSTDPDSSIMRYDWDFGDGAKASSPSPVADHVYTTAGQFQVTLTADSGAGCSTTFIATGSVPYCNGGPQAELTRQVTSAVPSIKALSVTNKRFAAGNSPASSSARKRKRTKRGTTFRFRLSHSATVRLAIVRRLLGRRVGRKCRPRTPRNAKRRRCVLIRKRGALSTNGSPGNNRLRFSGRLGKHKLRPGFYRATAIATTADKFKSAPTSVGFRVVRP